MHFDSDRERILYWGGGHCGYGGSDVDEYDVTEHSWIGTPAPDYPERTWNHGVRLAGMTFDGAPWTDHGRRVFAYDPPGRRMILVPRFWLTTGYRPNWLRGFSTDQSVAPDALVRPPSGYRAGVAYSYDLATRTWRLLGPAPTGMDTLLTTPHGAVGVTVNWPGRLNDAGYHLPWSPSDPPEENRIYLLKGARWERLGQGESPQNLYEMTSLTYDSKRDQVILHGGGKRRDELWTFSMKTRRWKNMRPTVVSPVGAEPPVCTRESVYLPDQDVMLIYGQRGEMWTYSPAANAWRQVRVPASEGAGMHAGVGQNRAMVYDPKRGLILLVLGAGGDEGKASVYALRFRASEAESAAAH